MNKKSEKRLCWNCEGNVSPHIAQCPYCGVDLSQPAPPESASIFKGFASPFQSAQQQGIPQPPYGKTAAQDFTLNQQEWNASLNEEKQENIEEESSSSSKPEIIALLLLLPGVVFFLFGIILILFSNEGILTLSWNQNVAYFYFLGATPLLYLGWRAFRK